MPLSRHTTADTGLSIDVIRAQRDAFMRDAEDARKAHRITADLLGKCYGECERLRAQIAADAAALEVAGLTASAQSARAALEGEVPSHEN